SRRASAPRIRSRLLRGGDEQLAPDAPAHDRGAVRARMRAVVAPRSSCESHAPTCSTAVEMSEVVAQNSFPARRKIEANRLVLFFLAAEPGHEACATRLGRHQGPEEVRVVGRRVYVHYQYQNVIGRSKLTGVAMERALGTSGTVATGTP